MNLLAIPKVELHRHLEGAVRWSTLLEWVRSKRPDLSQNELELRKLLLVEKPMESLKQVLDAFMTTQSLLDSPEVIERMAYEAVEDAHRENIHTLELRYSPSFIQLGHEHLSFEQIHQSILQGVAQAQEKYPIKVGLIGILGRTMSVEEATATANFVVANRHTFVAMDLADSEEGFDSKPFAPLFAKAKEAGLKITVHAGEINVPKAPEFVRDAIDLLHADRIGHGLQIHRSPEMIDYVVQKEIHLELCPLSNWLTNSVSSLEEHPFKKLYAAGISVSINSDDPGIFGTSLTDDYQVLADHHNFTRSDFDRCNEMAAQASFI